MNNPTIPAAPLPSGGRPENQNKQTLPPHPSAPLLKLVLLPTLLCLWLSLIPTLVQAQDPFPLSQDNLWISDDSNGTQSVAWGDVDGDGDLDLAVGNSYDPNKVYLNENGMLQTTATWSSGDSDWTSSVAWGDVDGDGDLDLAAANSDGANKMYLNENGMLQTMAAWSSEDDDDTGSVAWGDIDGDGDLDLAAGNGSSFSGAQANKVYLNENGMLQTTAAWTSGDSDWTSSVAWGDVDRDGDLDLAVGNWNAPNKVYLNENGMLQTTAAWSSGDDDDTNSVAWGDVDGDGDLDLAAGNGSPFSGAQFIKVYLNESEGLQTVADNLWSPDAFTFTGSVAWGDMDGDGDLDLAAGNQNAPNRVYVNENGILQTAADYPWWVSGDDDSTYSVAWGDIDGDGDLDLAVGTYSYDPNKVYLNENGMLQTAAAWSSNDSDWTHSVAWGDMDGDGDLDLALGNSDSNRVYLNENGMLQTAAAWTSGDSDKTQSVAWGDVDGDGDLDLAVGNDETPNKLYLNENGMLQTMAAWSSGDGDEDETWSVAWGDMDRDGDLDLAVGNWNAPNKVYLNENGVLQTTAVWSSNDDDDTNSVAWGDVDGDGDLDLAVANLIGYSNKVYLNENGMLQTTATWASGDDDDTTSVAWGDMDGDGDLDLAVGNWNAPNRVYLNENGVLQTAAVWISGDSVRTLSLAWDDVDGDGDLDLAEGNWNAPDKVYLNKYGVLQRGIPWSSGDDDETQSVAWGDVDGDGDLDLAVGNSDDRPNNKVYLNENGVLQIKATWSSGDDDETYSVAWGDMDGDGDLDLAVGNWNAPNRVYLNENGVLQTTAVWSSGDSDNTVSVAWGDMDGDGDLDLAVGNGDFSGAQANKVYLNENGMLQTAADNPWHSGDDDDTTSVAWGDVDGDGDLDLAAGNDETPNKMYLNENGVLQTAATWSSSDSYNTGSVAWGDVDGDGDLDLAAGNYRNAPNRVYLNENGMLQTAAAWTSGDNDSTQSVAWGDVDGDGDLDLAVGNSDSNKVYLNENGVLQTAADNPWFSNDSDSTRSVAWGDVDGDGDLDLAAGNRNDPNKVYLNGRPGHHLANNSPALSVSQPITPALASLYASAHPVTGPAIPITYRLFDQEGDPVRFIRAFYSPNGGGQWLPATLTADTQTTNLAASPWPTGTTHTLIWQADADLIRSENVAFRIEAHPGFTGPGPYQRPYASAQTFPFWVEAAEWYVKVISGTNPLEGAEIYQAGRLSTKTVSGSYLTDRVGLASLDDPEPNQPLVALHQIAEQPTTRAAHDGWAYRTYLTNLDLTSDGTPQPDTVGEPGEQRLVVREDNPLILFNIVASVEWDADAAYLTMLEDAFRKASAYLYDVTDGQMAFGQVSIYDKAEHWADADFQFSTKNTVRPYAFVGGIISEDESHTIRVGRFWDGGSGNQGAWNEPDGYRTLIHEFGHYALFLQDSYFLRQVDENGNFTGQIDAFCTEESIVNNGSDQSNATMMYYQYNATELSDKSHNWSENCLYTEQGRLNNNESDWETVRRHYPQLNSPTTRAGLMTGPTEFPTHLLPFPDIAMTNNGNSNGPSRQVTVRTEAGAVVANVLIALYTTLNGTTVAIDQGLTNRQGQIDVYGAVAGDTIRAATIDGALAGAVIVGDDPALPLPLFPTNLDQLTAQQSGAVPHLNLVPSTDGDSLTLRVREAASGPPLDAVVIPGEGAGSPQSTSLAYAPGSGTYSGNVSFAGVGLGTGRVRVTGQALPSAINSDYNLQETRVATATHLYAEDGNFELKIAADSLPTDGYATVVPTGYVPGPLPAGVQVIGSAYEVRLSGALSALEKDGLVRLHYHPQVMGEHTDIAIYYWDAAAKVWQKVGGTPSEVDNAYVVADKRLGIYALMGTAVEFPYGVYLPLIVK